ncbi:MAG TPA: hypothetical protein VMB74_01980 [Streptosporangiaceae bacterium]|nr:hypothetical protein [Streptosporangiaceae bacterium]
MWRAGSHIRGPSTTTPPRGATGGFVFPDPGCGVGLGLGEVLGLADAVGDALGDVPGEVLLDALADVLEELLADVLADGELASADAPAEAAEA